ncbi:hypothetical protein [Streptomyces sp. NPDC091383]|uniref:hypothetical protein n=1 Tax=Streptomyces sp. NPDC091383 TaxID=3365996 RepID=UPI0037FED45D
MSAELRSVQVICTVNDPDDLPYKDGELMYADDVIIELQEAVSAAVAAWYQRRGRELLACEPDVK